MWFHHFLSLNSNIIFAAYMYTTSYALMHFEYSILLRICSQVQEEYAYILI